MITAGAWVGGKVERFNRLEATVERQDTRLWLIEPWLGSGDPAEPMRSLTHTFREKL